MWPLSGATIQKCFKIFGARGVGATAAVAKSSAVLCGVAMGTTAIGINSELIRFSIHPCATSQPTPSFGVGARP